MKKWNPRFLAYCKSVGGSPEQVLARDREKYPGGHMAGFMLWIRDAWRRWASEVGEKEEWGGAWSSRQHEAFDAWLRAL